MSARSTIYVETSAVLSWLFRERAAAAVIRCLNAADVVTSKLTIAEALRAIVRAVRQERLTAADGLRLEGFLQHEIVAWNVMDIDDVIMERVGRPFPVEPVRTLDAMHLATMLEIVKASPDLQVLSFDERIEDNCRGLGLPLVLE